MEPTYDESALLDGFLDESLNLDVFLEPPSPASAAMGRPTKLSPEIIQRLCDALRAGNTREAAAQYAGICRATFYEWMERGRNPEYTRRGKLRANCKDFVDTVTRAENDAQVRNVATLQKAATGWPVKKTTMKTVKRIIGKTEVPNPKAGQKDEPDKLIRPVYATETTTTTLEYTEHDWRATLEWLQRRYPKEWGLRLKIEEIVTDELNDALDQLQGRLSQDEYAKVLEALAP